MNEQKFTQGDDVVLTFYAQDETGEPVSLTGATFVTKIPGKTAVVEFDNTKHAIVDAATGKYTLTLDAADTESVEAGQDKDILTTVTIDDKKTTYRNMGVLQVFPPAQSTAQVASSNIFIGAAL